MPLFKEEHYSIGKLSQISVVTWKVNCIFLSMKKKKIGYFLEFSWCGRKYYSLKFKESLFLFKEVIHSLCIKEFDLKSYK